MVRICLLALFVTNLPIVTAEPTINVAVYVGSGTSGSKAELFKSLDQNKSVKYSKVTVEDVQAGKLKDYHTVIFPGGSGGGQGKALEEKGREAVRSYVKDGGSYIGICAGSYLATNDYTWSLGILNAKVVDKAHWNRGHGPVKLTLTDKAKDLLQQKDKDIEIVYWQGPLLAPGDSKDLPAFDPLAKFETEIVENGASPGVMKRTVAIASSTYGKGRVLCFSPHPEKTESTYKMINGAIIWVSGRSK